LQRFRLKKTGPADVDPCPYLEKLKSKDRDMKKTLKKKWPFVLLILVGAGAWLWLVKFESEKPTVRLASDSPVIGRELKFQAGDQKSGIAEVKVEAIQTGQSLSLLAETFPKKTKLVEKVFSMHPRPQGLNEGEVRIKITVKDHSWNGGNPTILEKTMIIDTQSPQMNILGTQHYIRQGGTGFIAYTINEDVSSSGIRVGDVFYSGYPLSKNLFLVYFALPVGAPKDILFSGVAEDIAGNRTTSVFRPNIKASHFKKDEIQVTDRFLSNIIPYFKDRDAGLQGSDLDIYLVLNRKQREADYQQIQKICLETSPRPLWSGPFLRLPNAKPMASFGQERTYFFKGKEIDRQTHLGVDLASLAQSPIPAANSGRVVFAGPLGIYGNAVVLDHGCGLFSMYSHLSRIDVEVKKDVAKGDILGRSGATGLAGGDHLHYAVLVQGVFVDPIEWWDAHWIKDNIELKLGS